MERKSKVMKVQNKTNVLTLRLPVDLKRRLETQAKNQGISINQLASYLLNMELTQIETLMSLEEKLSAKELPELKQRVKAILFKVPKRKVLACDLK